MGEDTVGGEDVDFFLLLNVSNVRLRSWEHLR
jgi:hypothetical protein